MVAGFCDLVATDVLEFGSGFCAERVLRIEAQKILIGRLGLVQVGQVPLIDFGFCEKRAEAVAARGILMAEKFILADGVAEGLLILKDAALFSEDNRREYLLESKENIEATLRINPNLDNAPQLRSKLKEITEIMTSLR